MLLTVLYG
uniref:Uncharacterized protein n=1 Tax=Arundo donax TaxID=35708 RepID=A0A0A9BUG5_ARUDO